SVARGGPSHRPRYVGARGSHVGRGVPLLWAAWVAHQVRRSRCDPDRPRETQSSGFRRLSARLTVSHWSVGLPRRHPRLIRRRRPPARFTEPAEVASGRPRITGSDALAGGGQLDECGAEVWSDDRFGSASARDARSAGLVGWWASP